MNEVTLRLPRKLGPLSPNSRGHWAKKHKAAQKAKEIAGYAAIEATRDVARPPLFDRCTITVVVVGGKQVDSDNVVACAKSYIDGLQPRIVANDKHVTQATGSWRPAKFWERPHVVITAREEPCRAT